WLLVECETADPSSILSLFNLTPNRLFFTAKLLLPPKASSAENPNPPTWRSLLPPAPTPLEIPLLPLLPLPLLPFLPPPLILFQRADPRMGPSSSLRGAGSS